MARCSIEQTFLVYGYQTKHLTRWMQGFKYDHWRGVWVLVATVSATNPWAACRKAAKIKRGPYYWKLKAMPTWHRVPKNKKH